MMEEWKEIPGYEGLYEVSNIGNVRRVSDLMVLKFSDLKGYCRVRLRKDGKRKMYLVHRLVAQAFIPNPLNLPQVNHIDENKKNNNIDNLEWCDQTYNNLYGTRLERIRQTRLENGSYTGLTRQEYKKEYMRKYRVDHPVGYHYDKEYYKEYYEKNKDKKREYYEKNREKIRENQKKWRENNKDYHKKWLEKHPGYMDKYKKE